MTGIYGMPYAAAGFLNGQKEAPPLSALVREELDEFYGVRPLEKPVQVRPAEDINMISYDA